MALYTDPLIFVCSWSVLLWGLRIHTAGRTYSIQFLPISSPFIYTSMLALVQSFLSSVKVRKRLKSSTNLVCLVTTDFISRWHKYLTDYIFAYLAHAGQVFKFLLSLTTLGIWWKLQVFSPEKCPYDNTKFFVSDWGVFLDFWSLLWAPLERGAG